MKRFLPLLLAAFLLLLTACSGGSTGEVDQVYSMEQLQKAMLAADPTLAEGMLSITDKTEDAETNFPYLSDFPYKDVEGFLLSYSSTGTADEIAVIAVKDPDKVNAAADSLRDHLAHRQKLFETYTPAEAARAETGVVFTQGRNAVLIICDDIPAVRAAFEGYFD